MKHPLDRCNKFQEEFLANLPAEERESHAALFRIGNACYCYYQQQKKVPTEVDFQEWLQGLPEGIRDSIRRDGIEIHKNSLPFKRYILEKSDKGMEEFLREHLSEEDFTAWKKLGSK